MQRFWAVVAALAVLAGACKKSSSDADRGEGETPPAGAKVTVPAGDETVLAPMEMPVTTKSDQARALFIEGRTLTDLARGAEAEALFRKAIELDPDFASAHVYLSFTIAGTESEKAVARAEELSADLPAAEKLWIKAVAASFRNDLTAARTSYEELLAAAPRSWRAHQAAGNFLFGIDRAAAKEAFEAAVALNPENGGLYNAVAYLHAFSGDFDEAIAAATKQVELLPAEPNPLDSKAEIEIMAGKFAAAEATYKKTLETQADFGGARNGIAVSQIYRKDYDGAIATLTDAVKAAKRPNQRLQAQWFFVMTHVLAGKDEQALAAAADLAAPADEIGLVGAAIVARARTRIHMHRGAWSKAYKESKSEIAALEGVEAPLGQKASAHAIWVATAARAGDKAGAEKAFAALELLIEEGPQHAIARGHLAWARGDVDGALAAFAELDGTNQESIGLAATAGALEVAERADEAKAAWAKIANRHRKDADSVMFWHNAIDASK